MLTSIDVKFPSSISLRSRRFRAVSEQGTRPKPKILFLSLSLLWNQTGTLAKQTSLQLPVSRQVPGGKGMFSSADILQIADVVLRAVFLLCFLPHMLIIIWWRDEANKKRPEYWRSITIAFMSETTAMHVHHALKYISTWPLDDYDVKPRGRDVNIRRWLFLPLIEPG